MSKARPQPLDEPREFRVEELFFSITDPKGIIRHGNEVFCRISGYTEAELFGEPHNIIRHPDMPRAVFQLLWDTIKAGRTIAAYVKNLAKDGRYYWVLAVVMPCEGGYLSVRLKPTGSLLPAVEAIYADLLKVERRVEAETGHRRQAIDASVEALLARLPEAGFADYDAFMRQALSQEVAARHRAVGDATPAATRGLPEAGDEGDGLAAVMRHGGAVDASLQGLFERLDEFKSMNEALSGRSDSILDTAEEIRLLELNASIAANGLGTQGETLRVVARSLGTSSTSMEEAVGELTRQSVDVVAALDRLIFSVAATKLQSEIGRHFAAELLEGDGAAADPLKAASLRALLQEIGRRTEVVFDDLRAAEAGFNGLAQHIQTLLRRNKALRFVQFAGQKETASRAAAESLGALFTEAQSHVESTHEDCRALDRTVRGLQHHVTRTRAVEPEVLQHLAVLQDWNAGSPA